MFAILKMVTIYKPFPFHSLLPPSPHSDPDLFVPVWDGQTTPNLSLLAAVKHRQSLSTEISRDFTARARRPSEDVASGEICSARGFIFNVKWRNKPQNWIFLVNLAQGPWPSSLFLQPAIIHAPDLLFLNGFLMCILKEKKKKKGKISIFVLCSQPGSLRSLFFKMSSTFQVCSWISWFPKLLVRIIKAMVAGPAAVIWLLGKACRNLCVSFPFWEQLFLSLLLLHSVNFCWGSGLWAEQQKLLKFPSAPGWFQKSRGRKTWGKAVLEMRPGLDCTQWLKGEGTWTKTPSGSCSVWIFRQTCTLLEFPLFLPWPQQNLADQFGISVERSLEPVGDEIQRADDLPLLRDMYFLKTYGV